MDLRSAVPVVLLLGSLTGAALSRQKPEDAPRQTPQVMAAALAEASAVADAVTWDLPVVRNAPVERFVELFSGRQKDRMALYLKRSGRYEGMIRAKLRERGMPEDLLYLSMIESGFNPNARSKASAVGLWQFMEPTAEGYGLRVDRYVDERRHPEKSTDAALRYLGDLHKTFGSWYLAAAAYNSGQGRVSRVMKSQLGRVRGEEADFWRIRGRLPAETREYVPLMLGAAVVAKEPARYGLDHVQRWTPLDVNEVEVPGGTDLAVVARSVGVSEDEVKHLNPHLIRGTTPPGDKPYPVAIPRDRTERFAADFTRVNAEARTAAEARRAETRRVAARQTRTHRVRSGESLWTIARRNNTSVKALRSANGLGSRSVIRPGQRLRIPAR